MNDAKKTTEKPLDQKRSTSGRRRLLRLGGAAVVAGLIVARTRDYAGRSSTGATLPARSKVSFRKECVDCTGCITVCPTAALASTPHGTSLISEDLCIRCGYCMAVCPVQGVKVERESSDDV
ncbi:MAG: 4Fe-4S dicluster domain-containing protein [Deltaproteobacteria bacterium]|nr:4Fe-4S dicluster domain-containing protein [Deltaproteobacteria bacterium]